MTAIKELNHEHFTGLLDQAFSARLPDAAAADALQLTLTEVKALGGADTGQFQRQPFSLLFLGPPKPLLQQHMYKLENEQLGSLDIFLVPLGPQEDGLLYEAVFN